jgi:hypothetical protein
MIRALNLAAINAPTKAAFRACADPSTATRIVRIRESEPTGTIHRSFPNANSFQHDGLGVPGIDLNQTDGWHVT